MGRVILHVDMDAYFASVEQLGNPALASHPVIVSGDPDRRSVVAAANYMAREFGVKSGMPLSMARRRCPQGIFIEGDPEKYVYFSLKLKSICLRFTPLVELFSIDESFLDVTGLCERFGEACSLAKLLKIAIQKELGLTASVGISENKLLAKMASGLSKPDGLSSLFLNELGARLHPLRVGELFGVGEQTAAKLNALGIQTVLELSRFPLAALERLFGKAGVWMHQAANGIDDSPVIPEAERAPLKSMGNCFTLPRDSADREFLLKILFALCCKVGRRLRNSNVAGKTLVLNTRFADFDQISRSVTVRSFLCLDKELFDIARFLFDEVIIPLLGLQHPDSSARPSGKGGRKRLRMVGVSVSNLVSTDFSRQWPLLDYTFWQKYARATDSMDKIRNTWGEQVMTWGSLMR